MRLRFNFCSKKKNTGQVVLTEKPSVEITQVDTDLLFTRAVLRVVEGDLAAQIERELLVLEFGEERVVQTELAYKQWGNNPNDFRQKDKIYPKAMYGHGGCPQLPSHLKGLARQLARNVLNAQEA